MMTTYAKLTEDNDWEGETWYFWIPIEGNELTLKQLEGCLTEDDQYEVDMTPVPELEVDILVKHSDVGYLHTHNKLAGTLKFGDEQAVLIGRDGDPLYKGGIRDLMVST
jgi:hypothetical protein